MTTQTQKTCDQLVNDAAASRLDDLRILFTGASFNDIELIDDSPLDTVIRVYDHEHRFSDTSDYRDEDGELDLEDLWDDNADTINQELFESFYDYGLSFDYVAPDTFTNQEQGYFRYQISWGGPSEEFRFYVNPDLSCYCVEFWYLDWFDGAPRTLCDSDKALLMDIYQHFHECGCTETELAKAMDE